MRHGSCLLFLIGLGFTLPVLGCGSTPLAGKMKVIAHRGASGYLPEHTLEAYAAAYFMGADMIEADIVSTRDGQLICLHDLYLEKVTDVAQRYPGRQRADGHWYAIDFDLDEILTLDVTGRVDQPWSGFQIATLEQMLTLVARLNAQSGGSVAVIPELKDPAFHDREGIDLATRFIDTIERLGWDNDGCYIQCFQPDTLRGLHAEHGDRFQLLQLISDPEKVPPLEEIAKYAMGIGPSRKVIDADPDIVARAHEIGLLVIPYTFQDDPAPIDEYAHTLRVDGVFANYPDIAAQVIRD